MENWIQVAPDPRKLILAWQAPDHMGDRFRWAVGELEACGTGFSLRYFLAGPEFGRLNQNREFDQLLALGYKGYPAFSLKRKQHEAGVSEAFMSRLPPRNRPDFQDYMRQFRISSDISLSDFSLLGKTEAKLPSDGFSIADPLEPEVERCDLLLEIAGYRYYCPDHTVEVGCPAELLPEPDNAQDSDAVQVCLKGCKVGNINRLQAPTSLRWLGDRKIVGNIERLNGKPGKPRAFIFVRVLPAQVPIAA